jgi:hypothetical protein
MSPPNVRFIEGLRLEFATRTIQALCKSQQPPTAKNLRLVSISTLQTAAEES